MNYGPEVHGKTDTNDVMLTNEVYILYNLYIFAISKRFSYTEYIKYINFLLILYQPSPSFMRG